MALIRRPMRPISYLKDKQTNNNNKKTTVTEVSLSIITAVDTSPHTDSSVGLREHTTSAYQRLALPR